MTVAARDLVGAWRLVSWAIVSADGAERDYPLGTEAVGLILYTGDGHVSASLMRGGRAKAAPASDADRAQAYSESFAYAGRYEVRDGAVYHSIVIAANPALIGLTTTRHIKLDGRRLTLSGPDFSATSPRTQEIVWERASP